ncbi:MULTISPECIES: hypothetical protein [Rhodomicrobium]|uniref:hypothetical protein n=1 Tax=Rhodomicrobium TaxID=1068 RepID=UPI000B4BD5DB|nr:MULTISPECIES: hypothetical protein [Rhodomicrobium]
MSDKIASGEIARLEGLEREAMLALYASADAQNREALGLDCATLDTAGLLAARKLPVSVFNRAIGLGAGQAATQDALLAAIAWMRSHGAPASVLQIAPVAMPPELQSWIAAAGLKPQGTGWAKLWRRSSTVAEHGLATSLTVREIGEAHAADFGAVVAGGFGMPAMSAGWFAGVIGKPGFKSYLAYDGETPVASGVLYVEGDWGWIGFGATLADARRRGAQNALLARRIRDGLAMGARTLVAETGQPAPGEEDRHPSYRNLRRAGFETAYVRLNYGPLGG